MFKFKSKKRQTEEQTMNKHALLFGLISVFLIGISFSIITPVIPFLVEPYIRDTSNQATVVTLLVSVYALCMFFSAPILGALSDKFGRRPLLLISLLGSALGFLILGIGGALWVLFVGRIIEGITGGSISTIFAYFADITPRAQRTKYFGWVSAITGVGTVMGPALGGVLAAEFGHAAPLYFGAMITVLNVVYGFFFMPESLDKDKRLKEITFARLDPFHQLFSVLSMKNLNRILISAFLLWLPNGSLQAILSQFTIDTFNLKPALIGLIFSIMGIQDILSQGFIMPKLLLRFSDKQIMLLGMLSEVIGYGLIAGSALLTSYLLFIIGLFIFGFGDSIFGPAFNGMVSKSADSTEQGRVQGGSQSIQSLARIVGPVIGGQLYITIGSAAPAFMGMLLIAISIVVLSKMKDDCVDY
ncbi:MFS transporter [Candidatus Enterococcus lemimoniae]|uniref:MFS transporter, DHA1 family, tetracycline resistance protein n=1 Tax=Candidatus Enterococcus lemimoniae TaxID=1834167 RepID=A0ABZ2T5T5_9ENTE|nr:MFS transporter [Enterococcus sp. 12C11_DIV0727]OTO68042.1 permease [Enterococcus sp. 12C11_DIV0727]